MKQLSLLIVVLIALIGVSFSARLTRGTESSIPVEPLLSTDFAYDQHLFSSGVSQTKATPNPPQITRTMIIPHHLTASAVISQGISYLSSRTPPDTIVILSPNHQENGNCSVITSHNSWTTPFGVVDVDQESLRKFVDGNSICEDSQNLSSEHGIASLLPFIKYYLPNTKILPLAIKNSVSPEILNNLSTSLSKLERTTILASVDFSHGQLPPESNERDIYTKKIIEENDNSKVLGLSSAYLDSPTSLSVILGINKILKLEGKLLSYQDAEKINQKPNSNNTTYLLYAFSETKDSPDTWTLIATGDVMLGRSVNTQTLKHKDFNWAFRNINDLLKNADLTIINLESPLINDCPPTDSGMIFCGLPSHTEGLTLSGIDLANIANNHINNYGTRGVEETINTLRKSQITPVGIGNIAMKEVGGTKVAFLGFDLTSRFDENIILKSIAEQKALNPLVVVSFHWGAEYQRYPNQLQKYMAHKSVDAGADVIIGHHPHWVQTEEIYQGKPIYYSLGNLVFDQMWSEETKKGLIVKMHFKKNQFLSSEKILVDIKNYGQPKLARLTQTP